LTTKQSTGLPRFFHAQNRSRPGGHSPALTMLESITELVTASLYLIEPIELYSGKKVDRSMTAEIPPKVTRMRGSSTVNTFLVVLLTSFSKYPFTKASCSATLPVCSPMATMVTIKPGKGSPFIESAKDSPRFILSSMVSIAFTMLLLPMVPLTRSKEGSNPKPERSKRER